MSEEPKEPRLSGLRDWILPGGVTLGQVAIADPRLAAALLPEKSSKDVGVGGISGADFFGYDSGCPAFKWTTVNICGTFTSTEPKTIQAQLGSVITRDLWVRKITYTVRRPNAFAGSIFKAQSDHFNKLNPNVDWTLTVRSYGDWVIASDPTPLENIEMVFECVCPIGFVIGCALTIDATYTLLRALAEDEVPYNVCITLHAITIPRRYDFIAFDAAIALLSEQGIQCCP